MNYIEIFGPPGSGKSTIFSQLIKKESLYGGVYEDGLERYFISKSRTMDLKFKYLVHLLPGFIKSFYSKEFLRNKLGKEAFIDFISENKIQLQPLLLLLENIERETKPALKMLIDTMERYQIGITTKKETESLVVDEGFCQRAESILFRAAPGSSFSLQNYFDSLPKPDTILYIDAPENVCRQRQITRKKIISRINLKAQKYSRKCCEKIRDFLSTSIPVITVENTGPQKNTIKKIMHDL